MINLKYFDSSLIKVDKKLQKSFDIYYIDEFDDYKLIIMKIFIVQILYIWSLTEQMDLLKK